VVTATTAAAVTAAALAVAQAAAWAGLAWLDRRRGRRDLQRWRQQTQTGRLLAQRRPQDGLEGWR